MKRVYICSPYAGDRAANTENAIRYCRFAAERGCDPFAPHLFYTRFLNDAVPSERLFGVELGLRRIEECDELWVFGNTISPGMQAEIERAERIGRPVHYFNGELEERPFPKERTHGQNG